MESSTWLRRITLTLVAGFALRLIIGLVLLPGMPQVEDGPSYQRQAFGILDGTVTHFYFPPGTALCSVPFYALLGRSLAVDHIIASTFWTLFAISSAWVAWIVVKSKKMAWYATIMAAFLPHSLLATNTLSSQPLATAFVTFGLCLTLTSYKSWKWPTWIGASTCYALAIATRPASGMIVLAMFCVGGWLVVKRQVPLSRFCASMASLIVIIGALITPIMHHNAHSNQGWTISTNNEWNLLVGNNPYTPDYKTGHFGQRKIAELPPDAKAYLKAILPHEEPANATVLERAVMKDSALAFIADHPWRTMYRSVNRFRGIWGMDYTASRELQNVYGLPNKAVALLLLFEGGGFVLILLLAGIGFLDSTLYVPSKGFIILVILSLIAPYMVAFSVAKYHTMFLPLIFPAAAAAWMWITWPDTRHSVLMKWRYPIVIMSLIVIAIQVEHVFHIVEMR